jgi:nucleoside-diphosphate-sugar epimerase
MHVVTGAFSYTGSYLARELLSRGESVKTLSRVPDPEHPLSSEVAFGRLHFDDAALTEELRGADTLFNTYWVRFEARRVTWDAVLANTRTLLRAARAAGVRRIVHFSVSNASQNSPYSYFCAKAAAEREVRESGLSHAIVRPTLIVGRDDVLLNNIAWALRRLPLFLVPGDGRYRVQPITVEDLARLAVDVGESTNDVTRDAAGANTVQFGELVHAISRAIGARSRILRAPMPLALLAASTAGRILRDVVVTRDELRALMDELLVSGEPPAGATGVYTWLAENGYALGRAFVPEFRRNWA